MRLVIFTCSYLAYLLLFGQQVGGPCEGCEALYEYGNRVLENVDTLPGFDQANVKIHISGTVYKNDGITPASNVILYIYHTNEKGIYPKSGDEQGWARRHGYIRSWLKTGEDGRYSFYTLRPASYPNTTVEQHIHATIQEPDTNPYWIDSFLFSDDPFLTENKRRRTDNRGGSGVITLEKKDKLWTARRDIVLGLNIPNYPDRKD